MLQYFWSNWTEIPPELITRNFSATHIAWAASALVLIALSLTVYRRQSPETRRWVLIWLAVVAVSIEVSTWVWAVIMHCYTLQDMLPLHLCGVSVFVEFAAVLTQNRYCKEFTYALSLPAALLAILMPGWYYPFFTYRYLASALLHTLLVLIPVLIVWGDGFRPSWRRLPGCFILLLICMAGAGIADKLFGGNYMFLRFAPRDTILYTFYLWLGSPGYLAAACGVLLALWILLYLPWTVADRKKKTPVSAGH